MHLIFLVLNPLCFQSCLTKILLHKYLIPRSDF
jgi:hypothetical protein